MLAGKEYGSGSSRDWAAKGPKLLGVRSVLAESYERIHRSNLVGMGVLPLQFAAGESVASLGLTGEETFDVPDSARRRVRERRSVARSPDGDRRHRSTATVRIDTPKEWLYFRHGGILHYVLRQLLRQSRRADIRAAPWESGSRHESICSAERQRIEQELASLRSDRGDGELSNVDQHTADSGSELFEVERDRSMIDRLEHELSAIERAERRVDEGTYGVSVESGEPIPDGRLEAVPWAERTAQEQGRLDAR